MHNEYRRTAVIDSQLWTQMREMSYSLFTFSYGSEFKIQGSVKVRLSVVRDAYQTTAKNSRFVSEKSEFEVFVRRKLPILSILRLLSPV